MHFFLREKCQETTKEFIANIVLISANTVFFRII